MSMLDLGRRGIVSALTTVLGLTVAAHPTSAQDSHGTGLDFSSAAELAVVPEASIPFSGTTLPSAVDLSADLPPPGDQGRQNSCVGWAVAYALKSFLERREENWSLVNAGQPDLMHLFSPAYIYNQINRGQDAGSHFREALDLLHSQGVAPLNLAPYNPADYMSQPSAAARTAAARYRIETWQRIEPSDIIGLKALLNGKAPIVIGAYIDQSVVNAGAGFVWNSPGPPPQVGHAMVVVGYDDARSAFRVMNSWGAHWSDNGFFWISYGFFPTVVREGYVVKDAQNGAAPTPTPPAPGPGPAPVPTPVAGNGQLVVMNVLHNVQLGMMGPGMRIDGNIQIPPGTGGTGQIVVQFYTNVGGQKGQPIGSLSAQFATPYRTAATGGPPFGVPPGGIATNWWAVMPYNVLQVPRGLPYGPPIQTWLIAEATLFVNNFGVAVAQPIQFFVAL
jgi:hypothetical protein